MRSCTVPEIELLELEKEFAGQQSENSGSKASLSIQVQTSENSSSKASLSIHCKLTPHHHHVLRNIMTQCVVGLSGVVLMCLSVCQWLPVPVCGCAVCGGDCALLCVRDLCVPVCGSLAVCVCVLVVCVCACLRAVSQSVCVCVCVPHVCVCALGDACSVRLCCAKCVCVCARVNLKATTPVGPKRLGRRKRKRSQKSGAEAVLVHARFHASEFARVMVRVCHHPASHHAISCLLLSSQPLTGMSSLAVFEGL